MDPPDEQPQQFMSYAHVRPPLPQESSFESSCYYCRNVCRHHQSLLLQERPDLPISPTKESPGHFRKHAEVKERPKSLGVDVGVQTGKSTIHHYLFDPTQAEMISVNILGLNFTSIRCFCINIDNRWTFHK